MTEQTIEQVKEEEYKGYIEEHICNVQKVWKALQPYLVGIDWIDDYTYHTINANIEKHDMSKTNVQEFYGYRQWFYPIEGKEKNKMVFDRAWNHHQKANPHHWEYWIMADGTVLSMPFVYLIEMLCDWGAMSLKFGDVTSEFYRKARDGMLLHLDTIKMIDDNIYLIDNAVRDIRTKEIYP